MSRHLSTISQGKKRPFRNLQSNQKARRAFHLPWDSLVPRGCTLTTLPCIFEQPAWTRSVADEDTSALLHARELRNCDFCNQYCRPDGLRSPSKSPVMRQVHGLAESAHQGSDQWGAWLPQARLQARPKIPVHCLPAKEGEAKEREGKQPADKHQSLPRAQQGTSSRVALQVGAQCPRLSGLCLLRFHLPLGVLT